MEYTPNELMSLQYEQVCTVPSEEEAAFNEAFGREATDHISASYQTCFVDAINMLKEINPAEFKSEKAILIGNGLTFIVQTCFKEYGNDASKWGLTNDEYSQLKDAMMSFINISEVHSGLAGIGFAQADVDKVVKLFNGGEFPEGYEVSCTGCYPEDALFSSAPQADEFAVA